MGEEKRLVPVWEKELLSVKEAAAYFGIGENKIREMTDGHAILCTRAALRGSDDYFSHYV